MLAFFRNLFPSAPRIVRIPAPIKDPLTNRERMEIREWLASSMTQRVIGLMEAHHPGTNLRFPSYARSEWDERAAVTYLSRIKGWEMYRDRLLQLAEAPREQREPAENFTE